MTALANPSALAPASFIGRPGRSAPASLASGFEALLALGQPPATANPAVPPASQSRNGSQGSARPGHHAGLTDPGVGALGDRLDADPAPGPGPLVPDAPVLTPLALPVPEAETASVAPRNATADPRPGPQGALTANPAKAEASKPGSVIGPVRDGTPIQQVRDPSLQGGLEAFARLPGRPLNPGPDAHVPGRPADPFAAVSSRPDAATSQQGVAPAEPGLPRAKADGDAPGRPVVARTPDAPSPAAALAGVRLAGQGPTPGEGPTQPRLQAPVQGLVLVQAQAEDQIPTQVLPQVPGGGLGPATVAMLAQSAVRAIVPAPRPQTTAEPGPTPSGSGPTPTRRTGPAILSPAPSDLGTGSFLSAPAGIGGLGPIPQDPILATARAPEPPAAGVAGPAMAPDPQPAEPAATSLPGAAAPALRPEGVESAITLPAPVRGAPETVARLAAGMIEKLEARSGRFEIQLDPNGLGAVDVRVQIGADGQLTASLGFESARAASDLRGRADELRQSLEQAGFTVPDGGLSFDFTGQGRGRQSQPGLDPDDSRRGAGAFARAMTAQDAPPAVFTRFRTARGLDVLI
jgi:hypothetical protein